MNLLFGIAWLIVIVKVTLWDPSFASPFFFLFPDRVWSEPLVLRRPSELRLLDLDCFTPRSSRLPGLLSDFATLDLIHEKLKCTNKWVNSSDIGLGWLMNDELPVPADFNGDAQKCYAVPKKNWLRALQVHTSQLPRLYADSFSF